MRFEEVLVGGAMGAVLAHTYVLGGGRALKKGRLLDAADVAALSAAGIARVFVARLDDDDLGEDAAAARVAAVAAGPHVAVARATTGRANLFASARGVLLVDAGGVDRVNTLDERVTFATRPRFEVVSSGEMVATVKIIPFAVPAELVSRAEDAARGGLVRVAPFVHKRAGLVSTTLGAARGAFEDRGVASQRQRMAYVGGELARELRVPHAVEDVARALASLLDEGLDLVMVLGASAVVDRADVVPAAIERVGGEVLHLGMPVDPGNLLLLGRKGRVPVLGVPGCARSLKRSGFDGVLERIAADVPVTPRDIMLLGTGGLLEEVPGRPSPRLGQGDFMVPPRVAAVVLAAGMARRMGTNKLLEDVGGRPMIARVVDAFLASKAGPVVVVVGHEAARVRDALAGKQVVFVENPAYEEGLGASLRAGIAAVASMRDPAVDGALVALGDMPFVRPALVDQLIGAFDPRGAFSVCVPVHERKRGHPVLWSSRHFAEMAKLEGDVGARVLLERHADAVLQVPVEDPGIHLDVDTAAMLDAARVKSGGSENAR
jgi:molybdenum cofactor cytidylyltransferase